jgi:uncharacterized membrane protein YjgN (DUF898 family)
MNDTTTLAAQKQHLKFSFRATGAEYFRIWIVNLSLTILTLGIYSAWAKVRSLRYFYGNTVLDGSSFEYHASPLAILKGRLLVVGVYFAVVVASQFYPYISFILIPIILVGLPWVTMRARMFQTRMSSYRNVRFDFLGKYKESFTSLIGWGLLAVVTLYLLLPVWLWRRVKYNWGQAAYGRTPMHFTGPLKGFFKFFFKTLGLGLGMMAVVAAVFFAAKQTLVFGSIFSYPMIAAGAILGLCFLFLLLSYYQKSLFNEIFNHLQIGDARLQATFRTKKLAWIYISNFFGVILTFGLFYPWAMVRQLRYMVESLALTTEFGLNQFAAGEKRHTSATGEEVGDFFDVDVGV